MTTPSTTTATASAMSRPHSTEVSEAGGATLPGRPLGVGRMGSGPAGGVFGRDPGLNRWKLALATVRTTTAISPAVSPARSQLRSRATSAGSGSIRRPARWPRISVAVSSAASTTAKTRPMTVPSLCSGPFQCGAASVPRSPTRTTATSRTTSGTRAAAGRPAGGVPPAGSLVTSCRNMLRLTIRRPHLGPGTPGPGTPGAGRVHGRGVGPVRRPTAASTAPPSGPVQASAPSA